MPYINITTDLSQKAKAVEAIEAIAGLSPGSQVPVQIVVPIIHPESARLMVKNVFTATKRDTLANYVSPSNAENPQVQV